MLKIKRDIATECLALASNYPVVTVLGPRQSGKTTLVRSLFASKPYVNLELPDIRAMAQADPVTFIKQYETGAIFDEIQRVPELLSYLQVLVDDLEFNHKPYKGLFILTGSHQLELHAAIAQSLAGRNAILNLFPLSIRELSKAGMDYALDEYILNGFYPRIYKDKLNPLRNYRNYVQTYLEKDVRKIIN
ncbi:MAG: ATP-binding protein, partial [Gammaproteobacteria bacterium]